MILDTNALSTYVDGVAPSGEILRRQQCAALPVIVLGAFRYGITGSRHRKVYDEWPRANLSDFEVLAIPEETTIPYASLRGVLKKLGRPISANDAWIAALAIQHGLPILSRDERFDALPVVVITGHDTPEARTRVMNQGAKAYLRKPVDATMLLAAINAAIGPGAGSSEQRG